MRSTVMQFNIHLPTINVVSVILHNLTIHKLRFTGLITPKHVYIDNCGRNIEGLKFFMRENLNLNQTESFTLINSGIEQFPSHLFYYVTSLKVLNLSGNRILRFTTLFCLKKVWKLNLSSNNMQFLRTDFFEEMFNLQELDLRDNNFASFYQTPHVPHNLRQFMVLGKF